MLLFCALLSLAALLAQVPACRKPAYWLAALTMIQALTGIANVVFSWPLLAALLHTGGAAALVIAMTWLGSTTRSSAAARGAALHPPAELGRPLRGKG